VDKRLFQLLTLFNSAALQKNNMWMPRLQRSGWVYLTISYHIPR